MILRWLLVLAVVLAPSTGWAANAYVASQSIQAGANSQYLSTSGTLTVSVGDCLVVGASNLTTGATVTITDSYPSATVNTFTQVDDGTSSGQQLTTFYSKITTGGTYTITANYGGSVIYKNLSVHQVSGCPASPLGVHAMAAGLSSGAATTTTDGSYIFGMAVRDSSSAFTAGSGFTERASGTTDTSFMSEGQVQTSAGSISAEVTGAGSNVRTAMVTLKGDGAATSTPHNLLLMGVGQ